MAAAIARSIGNGRDDPHGPQNGAGAVMQKSMDFKTACFLIATLAEFFPKCFSADPRERRPLKIGSRNDLAEVAAGAIMPDEIAAALRLYTTNPLYLKSCRVGVARIDLNGAPAGVVTEAEALNAVQRLKAQKARRAAKTRATTPRSAPPSPTQPKRLSLSDLRRAAQARRAAAEVCV